MSQVSFNCRQGYAASAEATRAHQTGFAPMKLPPSFKPLKGFSRREQHLNAGRTGAGAGCLLWWWSGAGAGNPAGSESQHLLLDAQLQQVQRLQQQVKTLQAQPRMAPDDARRVLEASVKQQFGATAQMAVR